MKRVAISACLLGQKCRYDGADNESIELMDILKRSYLIPFCPEDFAFGSPRPTMDLVQTIDGDRALSNENGKDLSSPIADYANMFFDKNSDIDLFVGKDRSPSCGVCSAKLYDSDKNLISTDSMGLMAREANKRGINSIDAQSLIDETKQT